MNGDSKPSLAVIELEEKLPLCPFCKGKAVFFLERMIGISVLCTQCGASSANCESEDPHDAFYLWSIRT